MLLARGAAVTAALALTAAPLGFAAGLLVAVAARARSRIMRGLAAAYTTFFRGIPDLLALFIIYFGLQALLDRAGHALGGVRIELSAFVAGAIALAVVGAAYAAEVWVAALRTVPDGQMEAARSLGLSGSQIFRLVVVPQAIRVALPGLGNVWTVLLKDTSLISTLAVTDLLRAASEASKNTTRPILFYSAAALVYLAFSLVSGAGQALLEQRANRGYAR